MQGWGCPKRGGWRTRVPRPASAEARPSAPRPSRSPEPHQRASPPPPRSCTRRCSAGEYHSKRSLQTRHRQRRRRQWATKQRRSGKPSWRGPWVVPLSTPGTRCCPRWLPPRPKSQPLERPWRPAAGKAARCARNPRGPARVPSRRTPHRPRARSGAPRAAGVAPAPRLHSRCRRRCGRPPAAAPPTPRSAAARSWRAAGT
mmetsp:Transcript_52770/g.171667  ORF Transcript_52770/g.171667 Transcript_52770/m.171667 type:complete len:201 (-) Transcript_52770:1489-2091(-)